MDPACQAPTVAVLLSTYNGAHHLTQQLESLGAQEDVRVHLIVRDDSSTDATCAVLTEWQATMPANVILTKLDRGEEAAPLGIVKSYMTLLAHPAAAGADYVAFADQDDVWKPKKLRRAVDQLSAFAPDTPGLYCSRLEIVDEDLGHRGYSPALRKTPSFGNALVENVATGCSTVLNKAALQQVLSRPSTGAVMHDWWCYLVVSAFGRVHWDPEPMLAYRQHRHNAIGSGATPIERLMRKIRNQISGGSGNRLHRQIDAFLNAFGTDLSPSQHTLALGLIEARGDLAKRVRFVVSAEPWRQGVIDDLAYRLLLLLGRV